MGLPRPGEGSLGLAQLPLEALARSDGLRPLGVELGLALGQRRGSRRQRRCVPLFGLTPGGFRMRERLLDLTARRAFLTDQPVERRFAFGRLLGGRLLFAGGALLGGLHRFRGVGQLTLEGGARRRGVGKLGGEIGFAVRESLDIPGG
ncbi:MAG: hypothetical protein ACREF4_08440, partial [Gammaproteobacteria bacterium]